MSEENDVNFAHPVERELARLFGEHAVRSPTWPPRRSSGTIALRPEV